MFKVHSSQFKVSRLGLTLTELLISLTLGSFILLIIFKTFFDLLTLQRTLTAFNYLQTTGTRLILQLQQDIRWAKDITVPDSNQIIITRSNDTQIIYQWADDKLTSLTIGSPERLHPENVLVSDFSISLVPTRPQHLPLVKISLDLKSTDPKLTKLVSGKTLTVTNQKTVYEL